MTDISLVADVHSTREVWTGIGLADSVEGLVDAIRSEGWVDDLLAGAAFGLEVASTVLDPFSALLSSGVGWAMEYFEPLREMLDELAGMPDVVASHAATWENIATELDGVVADLQSSLASDLPDWHGATADAYQNLMVNNVDGIAALAGISSAIGAATQAASNLVAATRDIVRDLIADLVARVIVWAVEAIFVVTIPVVAAQIVAAVVKWAARIMMFVNALLNSLRSLVQLLNG
jgi:uncharacterized protein YukE